MLRKIIYFAGYFVFFKGKFLNFIKALKFQKESVKSSREKLIEIQKEKLYTLLNYSIKNIPYYRKIATGSEITISKDTIFEDLTKFPLLTKEIIRNHWHELQYNPKDKKYFQTTSGGTTGEPVKILHDYNFKIESNASTIVFDEIGGYKLGNKLVKLWGNEKEILDNTSGFINKVKSRWMQNIIFLNSFILSDTILENYIERIQKSRPRNIIAYVQSIFEMAKYVDKRNVELPKIQSIIVSAGVLDDKVKTYIERVFKCPVFNRYGSREVGLIASSCKKSNKLHINMFSQYIEILKENLIKSKEHESGNIIITNLNNFIMPLIRYKIGDRASFDYSKCLCGLENISFDTIMGRTVSLFKNLTGDQIDGEFFTHLFYFKEEIIQFQIIQKIIDEIQIHLVTIQNQPLNDILRQDLIDNIQKVMGSRCKVRFIYHNQILPSSSGKFQYTISYLE